MFDPIQEAKKKAGERAADFIEDGMTIGLGSGSTVYWTIKRIGELVKEGLNVTGIPSSRRTEGWANEFGVPLTTFSKVNQLDLAIDGADEVDRDLNLIKGGGGSLVREKIVNAASKHLVIIVDESKIVDTLGMFHLPVEVVPFGWEVTAQRLTQLGAKTVLRQKDNQVFVSDNHNYILDCDFGLIKEPSALHDQIKAIVGVVETGLFIGMTNTVIVGTTDTVKIVEKTV